MSTKVSKTSKQNPKRSGSDQLEDQPTELMKTVQEQFSTVIIDVQINTKDLKKCFFAALKAKREADVAAQKKKREEAVAKKKEAKEKKQKEKAEKKRKREEDLREKKEERRMCTTEGILEQVELLRSGDFTKDSEMYLKFKERFERFLSKKRKRRKVKVTYKPHTEQLIDVSN